MMENSQTTSHKRVLVIGAGLSGATIAERCAAAGADVTVIEKRDHIAGNVYDFIDETTQIRVSKYGAHLFHTDDEEVWNYVNRFGEWQRWEHRVVADVSGMLVPVPVNPTTVNLLLGTSLKTPADMDEWLDAEIPPMWGEPTPLQNSEEVAINRVGHRLYERLFRPYTIKQWGKEPRELEPSVLQRIPVCRDFDTRYFTDKFQALPKAGYTAIVQAMLAHPRIAVKLNMDFEYIKDIQTYDEVIFTGQIDQYFKDKGLPSLEYRSIKFEWNRIVCPGFYQPNSVVNYSDLTNPFTRCVEYKHFLHQKSIWSIYAKETTTDVGEPYYPVPTQRNRELYAAYQQLAAKEPHTHFVGRLASYKYYNMDQAIRAALDYFTSTLQARL